LIWTHHLKNITYNASFVPEGAPSTETYNGMILSAYLVYGCNSTKFVAMTLGAGVQWHEAYDAVQAQGRVLVGGITSGGSIGAAGGWLMGGGHSAIAPRYGLGKIPELRIHLLLTFSTLGVDNVIELKVVTSTGEYLTVNAHLHSDLYWALRGGGGCTYGIAVSVTYRTHSSVPLTGVFFSANSSNNATINKLFTEFMRIQPDLSDAGFSGYATVTSNSLQVQYIAPNLSQARTNQTIDPFFAYAQNFTSEGLNIESAFTAPFGSFYSWYTQFFSPSGTGEGVITELGSRLIPRDSVENNYKNVADVILAADGPKIWWYVSKVTPNNTLGADGFTYSFVAGGAVSRVNPNSTGLNPAWRRALGHLIFTTTWAEGTTTTEIENLRKPLARTLKKISDVTPGSGAYFNEVSDGHVLVYSPGSIIPHFPRHLCLSRTQATPSLVRTMEN
jgi:hypothetical protein